MERNEALKAAWHDNAVRANDDALTLLVQAYRFHRSQFYRWKTEWRGTMPAKTALDYARGDVAAAKRRYPASKVYPAVTWQEAKPVGNLPFPQYSKRGLAFVENPANAGLRHVGEVVAECGGRNGYWAMGTGSNGWYVDNDHGSSQGTVCGFVFQLAGRNNKARFVAGYRFSEHDGEGVMVDFGTIYEGESYWDGSPPDCNAAHEAARAADGMAEHAAEEEREYQSAWQAGSRYADLKRDSHDSRAEAVALLRERRAARAAGLAGYDAICASIRGTVSGLVGDISKARETMRKLAEGEYIASYLPGFHADEKRLREAFNEGAGEVILR